jgi:ribonuclease VapC
MIIDTSALVAILFMEADQSYFEEKIAEAGGGRISAVSYLETGMVLTSHFERLAESALDEFLIKAKIATAELDRKQAKVGLEAFRRYGKGRHRAGLNFGDCFSYALAKSAGEPLLFKGTDFGRTDIDVA